MSVILEVIAAKERANKSQRYIRSLRYYLQQFSKGRELTPISSISQEHIEQWLDRYPNPATRATWLNRLSALFAFARRRGYIERNPCDNIERISCDRNAPRILSVAQVEIILSRCPAKMRPYFVLCVFAGLRPEEIAAPKQKGKPARLLDWSAVNLETRTVTVFGKRRRRVVPLEPRAAHLLAPLAKTSGPVIGSHSTIRRWYASARELLGWKAWPQDIARHSAASYLMGLYKDSGKVSTILGNSSKVLLTHYVTPVTQSDCDFFWRTCQTMSDKGGLASGDSQLGLYGRGKTDGQDNTQNDPRNENKTSGKGPQATAQLELALHKAPGDANQTKTQMRL